MGFVTFVATTARTRHGRVLRRANILARTGRLDEALGLLRALRRRHPRDPDLLAQLAGLLNWSGRRQEAAEAMLLRARLHRDQGQTLKALAACDYALRIDPGNREDAHVLRGQLLADMGILHEAWESLEAAYEAAAGAGNGALES